MAKEEKKVLEYADTLEVWQWPEFKAFMKRLGYDVSSSRRHIKLTIDFDANSLVKVTEQTLVVSKWAEPYNVVWDEKLQDYVLDTETKEPTKETPDQEILTNW